MFQLKGWCVSEIGGGVFVFEQVRKKWRGLRFIWRRCVYKVGVRLMMRK